MLKSLRENGYDREFVFYSNISILFPGSIILWSFADLCCLYYIFVIFTLIQCVVVLDRMFFRNRWNVQLHNGLYWACVVTELLHISDASFGNKIVLCFTKLSAQLLLNCFYTHLLFVTGYIYMYIIYMCVCVRSWPMFNG